MADLTTEPMVDTRPHSGTDNSLATAGADEDPPNGEMIRRQVRMMRKSWTCAIREVLTVLRSSFTSLMRTFLLIYTCCNVVVGVRTFRLN